jgi:hypothetical protein
MRIAAKELIALMIAGASFNESARAQDASFGCKALLCAAASAPGWSAIPYCVPVMQDLFRQLAHGGAWPTCVDGRAGGLGYEPYLPCPTGTTPMEASGDSLGLVPSANGNFCVAASNAPPGCLEENSAGFCPAGVPKIPREPRSEPNYVDISSAHGVQRFYFSLLGF